MIHYEKMIEQLGKAHLPRMYLFDGDSENDDRKLLQETPYLRDGHAATVRFLRRREIENYLLVPEAIQAAIKQLLVVSGDARTGPDRLQIEADLAEITRANDGKLYPSGKTGDPERALKGSVALERIFDKYGIAYNKRTSGRLVAEHVTAGNQPALSEIWEIIQDLFPRLR